MIRCSHRSVWNDFPVPAGSLMMTLSVVRNRSRMGPRISARTRVDLLISEVDLVAHAAAQFDLRGAVEAQVLRLALGDLVPGGDVVLVPSAKAGEVGVGHRGDLLKAEVDDRLTVTGRQLIPDLLDDLADQLVRHVVLLSEGHERSEEHTSALQSLVRISY